jgi:PadR family transcriptional regulator
MRNKVSISSELLPGTLEMLILKALARGQAHGYAVARHPEQVSVDVLHVGENSLYPALRRLLVNGWVTGECGRNRFGPPCAVLRITPAAARARFSRDLTRRALEDVKDCRRERPLEIAGELRGLSVRSYGT